MTHRILLIDDDPDIRKVLKANLELHGFAVTTAGSWGEGRETLAQSAPDLLLLDIMLPDADGVRICREVRRDIPLLPIILLTARDSTSDKVMGLESGADDYVVKPFETLELIARIRACLRRSRPAAAGTVTVKELTVDFQKRVVSLAGRPVSLTPKEYDLLCFLISNRGSVLSRDDIRRHLWKESSLYSWSRVIDVHIQHLRQKMEKDPSSPEYILTVPGVGYRFAE